MEKLLERQESMKTQDAMTQRVVIEAKRIYESVADEAFLERCAKRAVKELWRDSIKVTNFVPVLAMRQVRESVDERKDVSVVVGPLGE